MAKSGAERVAAHRQRQAERIAELEAEVARLRAELAAPGQIGIIPLEPKGSRRRGGHGDVILAGTLAEGEPVRVTASGSIPSQVASVTLGRPAGNGDCYKHCRPQCKGIHAGPCGQCAA